MIPVAFRSRAYACKNMVIATFTALLSTSTFGIRTRGAHSSRLSRPESTHGIVLDTNVLVSYLLTHRPPVATIIEVHLAQGHIVPIAAPRLLAELARVLGYGKLQRYISPSHARPSRRPARRGRRAWRRGPGSPPASRAAVRQPPSRSADPQMRSSRSA